MEMVSFLGGSIRVEYLSRFGITLHQPDISGIDDKAETSEIASSPSWVQPMKATSVVFSILSRTGCKEGVREKGNSPQVFFDQNILFMTSRWRSLGNFCPLD